MTQEMEWDCSISRANDHTRKIMKQSCLELKTFFEQTQNGYNPSFISDTTDSVIVNSFPRRQTSSAEEEKKWMEAIMEAKSDSKKYLKGEIGLEDLAVKFVEKLESALTSQVDPKDSNLPNPSMDLNIMNVSSNQIHSRVTLTVAVSIFQAQLDRCGWEIARYNQMHFPVSNWTYQWKLTLLNNKVFWSN